MQGYTQARIKRRNDIRKLNPVMKKITDNFETSLTSENVKKLNVTQIRALIKYHNLHTSIRGYSKMKKVDLILSLVPYLKDLNKRLLDNKPLPLSPVKYEKESSPKRTFSRQVIISNYIKPSNNSVYFNKMSKAKQDQLLEDINDIVDSGYSLDLQLDKDKNIVAKKLNERNMKGIRNRRFGEGRLVGGVMKATNLQKFIASTFEDTTPNEIEGYKLDKGLSTKYTKVYWNDNLKRGVVSERPTNSLKDVFTDLYAGFDLLGLFKHPRFKNSWTVFDLVKAKYGSLSKFVGIGYSLGSIIVENYPQANEFSELFLVSKPILPSDILKGKKPLSNATEIRGNKDATSLLKPFQDKADREVVVDTKTKNPWESHKQANVFKQMDPEKEIGDPTILTGVGRSLKGMKVSELKSFAKKLSKVKQQNVLVGGKRKTELKKMILHLLDN